MSDQHEPGSWKSPKWINSFLFTQKNCQAQFKSSSSSVQLRTETGLNISVTPPHPTPPTHPTRASIFEALLGHLGS